LKRRYYIHSDEEAVKHNRRLGAIIEDEFTPWVYPRRNRRSLKVYMAWLSGMDHGPVEGIRQRCTGMLIGHRRRANQLTWWMQKIYRDA